MSTKIIEETVEACINEINALHSAVSRTNWAELNREGFVFNLEQNTSRIKTIYLKFDEINHEIKMLLEKNSPDFTDLINEVAKELVVLEANISMEKTKKLREELINENEAIEVPELYSAIQQKILTISLKMRYNIDKARNFLISRKTTPLTKGTTSRGLVEALQKKEDELNELKQKNIELKRKTYFGNLTEKNIVDTEFELQEMDKQLSITLDETKKSLKTHFAQISYVEGSFIQLKKQIEEIENSHSTFTQKAVELIRDLKKERDYSKNLALEMEKETLEKRSEYTKQLIEFEQKKNDFEEKIKQRYEKELNALKKGIEEKNLALKNSQKLVEQLEREIKLKKATKE